MRQLINTQTVVLKTSFSFLMISLSELYLVLTFNACMLLMYVCTLGYMAVANIKYGRFCFQCGLSFYDFCLTYLSLLDIYREHFNSC